MKQYKLLKDLPNIKAGTVKEETYWNFITAGEPQKYREWLEEVKSTEFKVGDWIVFDGDVHKNLIPTRIIRVLEDWDNSILFEKEQFGNALVSKQNEIHYRLATPEEIKAHLIKTAKEKGYRIGTKFRNMNTGYIQTISAVDHRYWPDDDHLCCGETERSEWGKSGSQSNATIYQKGVWAEIVEDKIMVNGYEMKNEGQKIWFGNKCANFVRDQFDHILSFNDFSRYHKATEINRKIKSITLDSGVTIDIETIQKIVEATK